MINTAELESKSVVEISQIIENYEKEKRNLKSEKQTLQSEKQTLQSEKQTLAEKLENQETLINALYEKMHLLKHWRFGKSAERYCDPVFQGRLFDEAEPAENTPEIEAAEAEIAVPAHKRKKGGRKSLPENLPRVEMIHDLSESEKLCACGCELAHIGDERTEQFDIIPEKLQVIVHVHKKYSCKGCQQTIKTAKKPQQAIPNSIATPGLLAHVLSRKFQYHLPLYRQEKMFHAIGVEIPRATLSHWVIKASELLQPLVNLLEDEIQDYDIAYADETTVQVLKEKDKVAESKSYMWVFGGGPPERFSLIYHYHPSRAHQKAIDFFTGYEGYVHCDGYQAYQNAAKLNQNMILAGCWYHVRRKFFDAAKVSKKAGIANYFLKEIQRLSRIERTLLDEKCTPEKIKEVRAEKAKPIIKKLKTKLDEYLSKTSSQSAIGKAIQYTLNQWPKLQTYLEDGRLEISTNRIERAIKPFAIGRKNWLFANSVPGAKAAAIIYSLVQTCEAHKVDPYDWLRYALAELPQCETVEQFEALLPFHFKKQIK